MNKYIPIEPIFHYCVKLNRFNHNFASFCLCRYFVIVEKKFGADNISFDFTLFATMCFVMYILNVCRRDISGPKGNSLQLLLKKNLIKPHEKWIVVLQLVYMCCSENGADKTFPMTSNFDPYSYTLSQTERGERRNADISLYIEAHRRSSTWQS